MDEDIIQHFMSDNYSSLVSSVVVYYVCNIYKIKCLLWTDLFEFTLVGKEIYDENGNKGKEKLALTDASCENNTISRKD